MALVAFWVTSMAGGAELESGANVYVLPMRSGFNLFLASQLTRSNALTVVTDPALADLVLTDSVGASFEQSMGELYPKPKPESAAKDADTTKKDSGTVASMADAYATAGARPSGFSRSDGTYFLVNRQSNVVVWSTFLSHRDTRNVTLNKDAHEIVKRLKKHLKTSSATAAH